MLFEVELSKRIAEEIERLTVNVALGMMDLPEYHKTTAKILALRTVITDYYIEIRQKLNEQR